MADKAFFIFGYAKNKRADMTIEEKKLVKVLAEELLSYSEEQLNQLVKANKLIEVVYER